MKPRLGIGMAVMLGIVSILACTVGAPPTATPVPPTPTTVPPTDTSVPPPATDTPAPAITDTPTPTPASGPCAFNLTGEATAYTRPSLDADVFGTVTPDLPIEPAATTADGWIGFDPGVAQAANVGPFRLRWVQPGDTVSLTGDCSSLPVIVGPPVGVCFEMFMEEVQVLASPDPAAAVIATAQPEDYVALIGQSGDWLKVDLSVGNLGLAQQGWIPAEAANVNGPCDSLPVVSP